MIINSIRDAYNLSREITYFKKEFPKIKSLFEDFDNSENPKASLDKIVSSAKINPITDDFLKISKTYDLVLRAEENASKSGWPYACLEAVKEMGVNIKFISKENIPLDDPSLYITNHPYGLLDSAAVLGSLGSMLKENDKSIKFIAMNQLRFIKGIENILHFVNTTTPSSNRKVLRDSIKYLDGGGNLAVCPAGTMSGPGLREYPWKNEIVPFISHATYVVPVWTSGPNHEGLYNLFARFEKTEKLRRVLSFREAWNKKGKDLYIKIGKPIPSKWIMDEIKDGKSRIEFLKKCSESLKVNV